MKLLLDLFGNWTGRRLGARRFAILWLLLFVELVAGVLLTLLIIAVTNRSLDFHQSAPLLAGVTFMVSALLFFAGMLNICLKRGRDIGMPGFVTAILFFVALMMGGVPMIFNIVLALVQEGSLALKST